jgi:MerR family transcriptional regulator/heat shock protein HspR
MGVQAPRLYEARGRLEPQRTIGGTRRHSANDLDSVRCIGDLVDAGLNLAGIALVLDLEIQNTELRAAAQVRRRNRSGSRPHRSPRADPRSGPTRTTNPVAAEALTNALTVPEMADRSWVTAEEADWMEQQTALPVDGEDEYPREPPAADSP